MSKGSDLYVTGAGEPVARESAGAPGRSSAQIRSDIEHQRQELGVSVDQLRRRVGELTDWRRQFEAHREELMVGAAAVGFAVGGLLMLRRRRRRGF